MNSIDQTAACISQRISLLKGLHWLHGTRPSSILLRSTDFDRLSSPERPSNEIDFFVRLPRCLQHLRDVARRTVLGTIHQLRLEYRGLAMFWHDRRTNSQKLRRRK